MNTEMTIGNRPEGGSSGIHCGGMEQYDFVVGSVGNAVRQRYISFTALGFEVEVYDVPKATEAERLYQAGAHSDLGTYLESLVINKLMKNPEILLQAMKDVRENAYTEGVKEGRRQKIREFHTALTA